MRYIKTFESFVDQDSDYDRQRIIKDLEKRAYYWFEKGELSKDAQLVQIRQTETAIAMRKSLIIEFNDNDFYYQLILRVNLEQMDKCEVILKKYNPNSETGEGLSLENQLTLTGENIVDVNDIKGEWVLDKIAELNDKNENPDKNDIEVPKDETPPEEGTPTEGGEAPPAGGTPPPAQGVPPAQAPPAQTPPPQGGAPAPAL
jgi:hypothetical protein